jgi:hypothetical protein
MQVSRGTARRRAEGASINRNPPRLQARRSCQGAPTSITLFNGTSSHFMAS